MKVVLALALVCGLFGCVTARPAPTATVLQSVSPQLPLTSPSPTSSPSLPLSPAGIPQDRAVELARDHTSFTNFVSAEARPARDVDVPPAPGYPIKPDQIVWAVRFSGAVTICNPEGACFSPRPGTIDVFLDYATGDFISSTAYAPAP